MFDSTTFSLTRASLQIKRIKKRKSAPVLNEICEENEPESDFSDVVKDDHHPYHQTNHVHQFGRHSISTSSPYSHRQHHTAFSGKDSLKEDSGSAKSATLYGVRTGQFVPFRSGHHYTAVLLLHSCVGCSCVLANVTRNVYNMWAMTPQNNNNNELYGSIV